MFGFQVCGFHNTGKTTTVKELIHRIKIGGQRVASIKQIHFEGFQIDQPNKNSFIHKAAGANPVVARGEKETDFLYDQRMDFMEIVRKIDADWLVVEGFDDFPLPKIVCGATEADLDAFMDNRTFAFSGIVGTKRQEYRGLRVFNPMEAEQAQQLWELVAGKVFPMLPYVDDACCRLCGLTCSKLVEAIIQGEKSRADCTIDQSRVVLKIDGKRISIVPFVQKILQNNVESLARELDGWEEGKTIEVIIEK